MDNLHPAVLVQGPYLSCPIAIVFQAHPMLQCCGSFRIENGPVSSAPLKHPLRLSPLEQLRNDLHFPRSHPRLQGVLLQNPSLKPGAEFLPQMRQNDPCQSGQFDPAPVWTTAALFYSWASRNRQQLSPIEVPARPADLCLRGGILTRRLVPNQCPAKIRPMATIVTTPLDARWRRLLTDEFAVIETPSLVRCRTEACCAPALPRGEAIASRRIGFSPRRRTGAPGNLGQPVRRRRSLLDPCPFSSSRVPSAAASGMAERDGRLYWAFGAANDEGLFNREGSWLLAVAGHLSADLISPGRGAARPAWPIPARPGNSCGPGAPRTAGWSPSRRHRGSPGTKMGAGRP